MVRTDTRSIAEVLLSVQLADVCTADNRVCFMNMFANEHVRKPISTGWVVNLLGDRLKKGKKLAQQSCTPWSRHKINCPSRSHLAEWQPGTLVPDGGWLYNYDTAQ